MKDLDALLIIILLVIIALGLGGFWDVIGGDQTDANIIVICDPDNGVGMLVYGPHGATMTDAQFARLCVPESANDGANYE